MAQTFEQILSELLKKQAENPDIDVNALIAQAFAENGIGEAGKGLYEGSAACLDEINAKYNDLREAKDEGTSRGSWLASQLDTAAQNLPESERDEFFSEIQEGIASADDNVIKED